jgi:hypothetical protein
MQRLVHLLGGLEIGGKERVALELARRARRLGLAHELLLFDRDYRDPVEHLDPGDVPCTLLRRGKGLDLRFTASLAGWLERERVEVVHAHNDSALVYGVLAARRAPRRPRSGMIRAPTAQRAHARGAGAAPP